MSFPQHPFHTIDITSGEALNVAAGEGHPRDQWATRRPSEATRRRALITLAALLGL
jgi:hypothetical protein